MSEDRLCTDPRHRDQMTWGHHCPSAPWQWGQKAPRPETDDSVLMPYRRSAIGLIRDFELGDIDDESLIDEVAQEISETILDLGPQLKAERL